MAVNCVLLLRDHSRAQTETGCLRMVLSLVSCHIFGKQVVDPQTYSRSRSAGSMWPTRRTQSGFDTLKMFFCSYFDSVDAESNADMIHISHMLCLHAACSCA